LDELFVSRKHHVTRAAFAAEARLIHPVEWDAALLERVAVSANQLKGL
jgi:hypothetical protein